MVENAYSLRFDGYYFKTQTDRLPTTSGIYGVYGLSNSFRLIYIGESSNVRDRVENHEKRTKWQSKIRTGEKICFNVALISSRERQRAEAAMIYKHKPPCNTEHVNSFQFDTTTIRTSGKNACMHDRFTVRRKLRVIGKKF
ncbi:MAG: GIY-YIG nuclease family protein [Hyphomicrobiales bacterium]|nr:GIY-YIG nuclease family protein [Hyphomicrobiales bacterium]